MSAVLGHFLNSFVMIGSARAVSNYAKKNVYRNQVRCIYIYLYEYLLLKDTPTRPFSSSAGLLTQ